LIFIEGRSFLQNHPKLIERLQKKWEEEKQTDPHNYNFYDFHEIFSILDNFKKHPNIFPQ